MFAADGDGGTIGLGGGEVRSEFRQMVETRISG
jgi:hypothetical protein